MAAARPIAILHRHRRPLGQDYVPTSFVSPWARLPRPGIHPRIEEDSGLHLAALAMYASRADRTATL